MGILNYKFNQLAMANEKNRQKIIKQILQLAQNKLVIKNEKRKKPSKRHKGGLPKQKIQTQRQKSIKKTKKKKHEKTRNLNQKILKFIGVDSLYKNILEAMQSKINKTVKNYKQELKIKQP